MNIGRQTDIHIYMRYMNIYQNNFTLHFVLVFFQNKLFIIYVRLYCYYIYIIIAISYFLLLIIIRLYSILLPGITCCCVTQPQQRLLSWQSVGSQQPGDVQFSKKEHFQRMNNNHMNIFCYNHISLFCRCCWKEIII